MRLAPVPIFYAHDAREAISRAADSSRTTHGAAQAVDACRHFAGLLVGALLAANLGDDADTTAAIYGQIAGAYCGDERIPREWREVVHERT
jgi:ADP-ribosylglycohydrolase